MRDHIEITDATLLARDGGTPRGEGKKPVRLWLVDNDVRLRGLYAELLGETDGLECEREYSSAEALLAGLKLGARPDVVLLDNHMGGMKGVDAVPLIRGIAPSLRVLMLTTFSHGLDEVKALHAGASGFLLKTYGLEEIIENIFKAARGPGLAERARAFESRAESYARSSNATSHKPNGVNQDAKPGGWLRGLSAFWNSRRPVTS
jgi:DNA-binding NarL/FixJ family response regulator